MYKAIFDIVGRASTDTAIAAIVISGAGAKASAAGTDIAEFRSIKTAEDALAAESKIDRILGASRPAQSLSSRRLPGGAAIAAC